MSELRTALGLGAVGVEAILDALAEAVTVRDPDGGLLYANRRALESLGYSSLEEMQRRGLAAVFDDYLVRDERGRELRLQDLPSVRLLEGEPAAPLVLQQVHRASGETSWRLLKSTPLRDDSGRVLAAVTVIEDITQERLAERRERFLVEATERLMSSLDYEETLRNVAWLAIPQMADWCAIDLLGSRGELRRVVVAHHDPDKLALVDRLTEYANAETGRDRPIHHVAREGVTLLVPEVPDQVLADNASDEEHLRLLREFGFRSALLVPLRARDRTIGVLTLATSDSLRRLDEGDREFGERLAGLAALAVDNARLATERQVVSETLQRNLLPQRVPHLPGWEVATLYNAAGAGGAAVGGDFFDFVATPEGWVVLLGDVTGRGLAASATTLLVRHGARFAGRQEGSPAAILRHLNDVLLDEDSLSLCSAICARLEPGGLVFSSAGHPPPLLISPAGEVRALGPIEPILGAWRGIGWHEHYADVADGQTILLYTDGLVELHGTHGRFGHRRLQRVLREHADASPQEIVAGLQRALDDFGVEEQRDDSAAVALRRSTGTG